MLLRRAGSCWSPGRLPSSRLSTFPCWTSPRALALRQTSIQAMGTLPGFLPACIDFHTFPCQADFFRTSLTSSGLAACRGAVLLGAGCLDVMYVPEIASRMQGLEWLDVLGKGKHLEGDLTHLRKASAMIIEPHSSGAHRVKCKRARQHLRVTVLMHLSAAPVFHSGCLHWSTLTAVSNNQPVWCPQVPHWW